MGGDADPEKSSKVPGRDPGRPLGACLVIAVGALLALGTWFIFAAGWLLNVPLVSMKDSPSCSSNVKQICLGLSMYNQDWDDRFPPHQDWPDALYPYMKNRRLYVCPQARNIPVGYAYRQSFDLRPIKSVGPPEKTIVFWDRQRQTELPAFRHNEGLWVGYVDGHAKWLKQEAFLQARSHRP